MTEGSYDDGNYLVRVRAQVMTRDDSTGGWLPMGGGGLSNVSVRKRLLSSSSSSSVPVQPATVVGVGYGNKNSSTVTTRGSSSYSSGTCCPNAGGSDEELDISTKHEYLIYGKRICDSTVVLSCPIRKDFQYNKVMPTFHHWRTGDKKYGLTFQTAADARAFDKGVRRAVEDLLEGIGELTCFHDADMGDDDVFMTLELPVDSRSSSGSSSASGGGSGVVVTASTLGRHPLNPLSVFSGSGDPTSISQSTSPYTHPHANHHHLHRMHFIRSCGSGGTTRPHNMQSVFTSPPEQWTHNPVSYDMGGGGLGGGNGGLGLPPGSDPQAQLAKDIWVPNNKIAKQLPEDRIEILSSGEPYSYVQFAKDKVPRMDHEYSYPVMDALKLGGMGSGSSGSLKKKQQLHASGMTAVPSPALMLPTKCKRKKDIFGRHGLQSLVGQSSLAGSGGSGRGGGRSSTGGRAQCRHCLELYSRDDNGRGSCEYAPDGVLACINAATCISCAQCMLYHCMSDAEGDFDQHPCSCDGSDDHCQRRWISMALLSLFVPCLWCYLPLRACHRCATQCGACGGRHQPV